MNAILSLTLLSMLVAAELRAQRIPVADAGDRELHLVDLRPLLRTDGDGAREDGAGEGKPESRPLGALRAAAPADDAFGDDLAAFLRAFVQPPLRAGDDIALLGPHHVAVLGQPAQCLWVARLVADAIRNQQQLLDIEVRMAELDAAAYQALLAPFFAADAAPQPADGTPRQRIAAASDTAALLQQLAGDARVRMLMAPRIATTQLGHCSMQVGDVVSYVRDFDLVTENGNKIADPVVDSLFDGTRIAVRAALVAADQIAVGCAVEVTTVQRPLAETAVDLGVGKPVTIQLPRARTVKFAQRAVLPTGHAIVVASRRQDGGWLAAVLTVRQLPR